MSVSAKNHNLSKLPKWAYDLIVLLERDRDEWREAFMKRSGPVTAKTRIVLDPDSQVARPLADWATVRFMFDEDSYVDAHYDKHLNGVALHVGGRGTYALLFRPQSSNVGTVIRGDL